jgi:hypothetical protein
MTGAATAGSAKAQAVQPKEQLVKDIPLQNFFHTSHPLRVKIYQVAHPAFRVGVSIYPLRVCFVQPPVPQEASIECTRLGTPGNEYQQLVSAELRMLPGAPGKPDRPSLVIQAIANTGPSGPDAAHGLFVWTRVDSAYPTFTYSLGLTGEQEFVENGPLRGAFVAVTQVGGGGETSALSPSHYQMTIYEPFSLGYVKVLTVRSKKRYVSDQTGDGLQGTAAITALMPELVGTLKAVYPRGVYTSAVQW